MSRKSATISLAFLSLTLVLAPCSAKTDCPGYNSVSKVLKHYDIPAGLFPNNVQGFSCVPLDKDDALELSIQLPGVCRVTRALAEVGNFVTCQPNISAIISYRKLSDIKGVTVTLTFYGKPLGELMTITEAKVFETPILGKVIQFYSDKGDSPWFPVGLIQEPPTCDPTVFDVVAKNFRDTPRGVYDYVRLLPIVA